MASAAALPARTALPTVTFAHATGHFCAHQPVGNQTVEDYPDCAVLQPGESSDLPDPEARLCSGENPDDSGHGWRHDHGRRLGEVHGHPIIQIHPRTDPVSDSWPLTRRPVPPSP